MYTEGNTGFFVRVKTSHLLSFVTSISGALTGAPTSSLDGGGTVVGYRTGGERDEGSGVTGGEAGLLSLLSISLLIMKSDMNQGAASSSEAVVSSISRDSGDN